MSAQLIDTGIDLQTVSGVRVHASPLIDIAGVTKTYGEGTSAFQALRGIDFRIFPGEFSEAPDPAKS